MKADHDTADRGARAPTIRDVAREAGLSPSTVSRVLNNSPLIGKEQARRVREAAARLGYEPLRKRRQAGRTIINVALILPKAGESHLHLFYDPGALMASIHHAFGDTRVNLITVPDAEWPGLFEHKKLGSIDGCIMAFIDPPDELVTTLDQWSIPAVVLNRRAEKINYVSCENAGGMANLVGRVVDVLGPDTRIQYIDFSRIPHVADARRDGVFGGARRHGLPDDAVNVETIDTLTQINDAFFERLLANKPDALMCFNDIIAVYVYQAALHRGIRIPEEFSLTGFDNSPVRTLLDRRIDSVDLGADELGARSARWLYRRIIERSEEPITECTTPQYVAGDTLAPSPRKQK